MKQRELNDKILKIDGIESKLVDITSNVLSGKSFRYITQSEYDILSDADKNDENIVYYITDVESLKLTSSDGSKWILKIGNDGVLFTEKIQYGNTPVTGITLNKSTSTLKVNDTEQLIATIIPINATDKNITWSSDNTDIATVNNGLVTAKLVGSANISATSVNGNRIATCSYEISSITPPPSTEFTNYIYNSDTYLNPAVGVHPNAATYYLKSKTSITVSSGIATLTKTGLESEDSYFLVKQNKGDNNKYYTRGLIKTTVDGITSGNNSLAKEIVLNDGVWHLSSFIFTDSSASSNGFSVILGKCATGSIVYVKELMHINLTEIYGSGNEPTKEACDAIFTTYKIGLIG